MADKLIRLTCLLFTFLCHWFVCHSLPFDTNTIDVSPQKAQVQILKFFLNSFFPILKTTREAKSLCHKELFLLKNDWLGMANSIRKSAKITEVRGRVKRPHPTRRLTSACVCICRQNISCKNFPKKLY